MQRSIYTGNLFVVVKRKDFGANCPSSDPDFIILDCVSLDKLNNFFSGSVLLSIIGIK